MTVSASVKLIPKSTSWANKTWKAHSPPLGASHYWTWIKQLTRGPFHWRPFSHNFYSREISFDCKPLPNYHINTIFCLWLHVLHRLHNAKHCNDQFIRIGIRTTSIFLSILNYNERIASEMGLVLRTHGRYGCALQYLAHGWGWAIVCLLWGIWRNLTCHNSTPLYMTGLILGLCPANERRRYKVTPSLIGCSQT